MAKEHDHVDVITGASRGIAKVFGKRGLTDRPPRGGPSAGAGLVGSSTGKPKVVGEAE